jgi:glyoxylase-like metal-dependent hydrolase (beta-lactamase superfamily II)
MNAASAPSSNRGPGAEIVQLILDDAAKGNISIHPLRGNLSVLMGSGGNVGILTGPEGTLLVDAGIEVSRPKIAETLVTAGVGPLHKLINTHWHFDHTSGNNWVHSAGATIIAHENTRKHLSVMTRVEGWRRNFPAPPGGALPTVVFSQDFTVRHNGLAIELRYYGPAHTDADISVRFGDADILFVGDTWWNGVYPFIDYSTGGSVDAMIRACEWNLANTTDETLIVPGHGPAGHKAELAVFRDMLVVNREIVAALKKQGRSVEEAIALNPTAEYDAAWGSMVPPGLFVESVYASL